MIKDEKIPDEVVEAASKAAWETKYVGMNWLLDCSEKHKEQWRKRIRAALIAGLAAWPNGEVRQSIQKPHDTAWYPPYISLPLPQEPRT